MSSTAAKVAAAKLRAIQAEADVAEAEKKAAAILAALRRAELEYEIALAGDADVDESSSSAAAAGSKVAMDMSNPCANNGVESCFFFVCGCTTERCHKWISAGAGKGCRGR